MSTISVELASVVAIAASTMGLSLTGFEAVSLSTAGDSLAADSLALRSSWNSYLILAIRSAALLL